MQVYKLFPQNFAANTYFITADGKRALCVDPAQPRALQEAQRLGLAVEYVLLTHGHFDHLGGCAALQAHGAKIGCPLQEEELALHHDLGEEFGYGRTPPFQIDFTVKDGEELSFLGLRIRVIATPGHTAGSVCYLVSESETTLPSPSERSLPQAAGGPSPLPSPLGGKVPEAEGGCLYSLFTGDTLFRGDVGRTDLPTGSEQTLAESLKKLRALPFACTIYPGHGENSTLAYEKSHNGYLKC